MKLRATRTTVRLCAMTAVILIAGEAFAVPPAAEQNAQVKLVAAATDVKPVSRTVLVPLPAREASGGSGTLTLVAVGSLLLGLAAAVRRTT